MSRKIKYPISISTFPELKRLLTLTIENHHLMPGGVHRIVEVRGGIESFAGDPLEFTFFPDLLDHLSLGIIDEDAV